MTESLIDRVREMAPFFGNQSVPKMESLNHIDLGDILGHDVDRRWSRYMCGEMLDGALRRSVWVDKTDMASKTVELDCEP